MNATPDMTGASTRNARCDFCDREATECSASFDVNLPDGDGFGVDDVRACQWHWGWITRCSDEGVTWPESMLMRLTDIWVAQGEAFDV